MKSNMVSSVFIKLPITFCSYKKLAIFTTNVDAENQCLINHKCVCGALNRQFFVGAVCALHEHDAQIGKVKDSEEKTKLLFI